MPVTVTEAVWFFNRRKQFYMPLFDSVYLKNLKLDFSVIFTEKGQNHTNNFSKEITKIFFTSVTDIGFQTFEPIFLGHPVHVLRESVSIKSATTARSLTFELNP